MASVLIYLVLLASVFSTTTSQGTVFNCPISIEYCSGSLSTSCSNETLTIANLTASCPDDSGVYSITSLDLDEHIANIDGELHCLTGTGNYSASCSNTTLTDGHVLNSYCYTYYSELTKATIDLDCCVTNDDGTLSWTRGVGYGATMNLATATR